MFVHQLRVVDKHTLDKPIYYIIIYYLDYIKYDIYQDDSSSSPQLLLLRSRLDKPIYSNIYIILDKPKTQCLCLFNITHIMP